MAENFFARQGAAYINELRRSCGALMGIAQGILCDRHLADAEIHFLNEWLTQNDAIANEWPGDVLHYRIRAALADGVITEDERKHLVDTLQQLIGGALEDLARQKGEPRNSLCDTSSKTRLVTCDEQRSPFQVGE